MNRRQFVTQVVGWAASSAVCPIGARAQRQAGPVIGYLDTASASVTAHLMAEFHRGLKDAGFIEGQNVASPRSIRRVFLPPKQLPTQFR